MNPPEPQMTPGTTYTMREAAQAAGVSLSTAKRRRPELKKAGATQDARGRWTIPETALYVLTGGSPTDPREPVNEPQNDPRELLLNQIEELQTRLRAVEVEAAAWEARAAERLERVKSAEAQLTKAIEEAQRNASRLAQIEAVRQLAAVQTAEPAEPVPEVPKPSNPEREPVPTVPPRSFFGRLFRKG
jgi:hypothetical protein